MTTPEVQAAVERVTAHCPGMPPAMEPLDRDDLRAILSALATSEARRDGLELAFQGVIHDLELDGDHIAAALVQEAMDTALNPQQEGSRDHG